MVGNLSATLNVVRLLFDPALCLPHATISTFAHLKIPISDNFEGHKADIRAVILDKDNCFAIPGENNVHKPYSETFEALRKAYPGNKLLIVSNSSGTSNDKDFIEANLLSDATSVPVFRHTTKKPGCHAEIIAHLKSCSDVELESPSQIAVIGDRLFTDVMMANMMGAWAVYVKDGVDRRYSTFFSRMEWRMHAFLPRRGWIPQIPK